MNCFGRVFEYIIYYVYAIIIDSVINKVHQRLCFILKSRGCYGFDILKFVILVEFMDNFDNTSHAVTISCVCVCVSYD